MRFRRRFRSRSRFGKRRLRRGFRSRGRRRGFRRRRGGGRPMRIGIRM